MRSLSCLATKCPVYADEYCWNFGFQKESVSNCQGDNEVKSSKYGDHAFQDIGRM